MLERGRATWSRWSTSPPSRPTRARRSGRSRRAPPTASSTPRWCRSVTPRGQGDETEIEFAIDQEKFHDAFAADVPPADSALMGATQRPVSARAFTESTTAAAWKALPCWAVIPTGDHAAGSDVLRQMAQRAGMTISEVEGSHVAFVTKPQPVIDAVLEAVRSVQGAGSAPANA